MNRTDLTQCKAIKFFIIEYDVRCCFHKCPLSHWKKWQYLIRKEYTGVGRWRLPWTMGRVSKSFICVTSWLSSISNHRTQISWLPGTDLEASLLSFEKLDRASPDLWPEQLPGVAEFAASFKSPITSSPPKWMAEIERDDIDMLKELGSLTTANLMEKVRGLQNLAYQLGLDECEYPDHIYLGAILCISWCVRA